MKGHRDVRASAGPGTNGKETISEGMRERLRAAEAEAAALREQLALARQQTTSEAPTVCDLRTHSCCVTWEVCSSD